MPKKVLVPPIDARLKELFLKKQAEYNYEVLEMEVMPEHVPLLLDVDPRAGIDAVVRKIKGYTAHTIPGKTGDTLRKEYPWMKSRLLSMWTRSRFIASVGSVSQEVVKQNIEAQKGK